MSNSSQSFAKNLRAVANSSVEDVVEYQQSSSYKVSSCGASPRSTTPSCKIDFDKVVSTCDTQSLSGTSLVFQPKQVKVDLSEMQVKSTHIISPKRQCATQVVTTCAGGKGAVLDNKAIPYVSVGSFIVIFIISLILYGWYKPNFVLKDCPKSHCPELNYGKLIGWSLLTALIIVAALAIIYGLLSYVA